MSKPSVGAPRRTRVERNIYRRQDGRYELGMRDGAGVLRWRTVDGGIQAARALRDEFATARRRGERVAANPRLRFGEAADLWLAGPVTDLRRTTQDAYAVAVRKHLIPRFKTRRLDSISPDDLAELVRDLRADGYADTTISVVLSVVGRIYKYAARRLGFAGANPVSLMLSSERPRATSSKRRAIFTPEQVEQTLAASTEPFRTVFLLLAFTGARISEALALTWQDVALDDLEDAHVTFGFQLSRRRQDGEPERVPTKTDGSARTVPVPRELATVLAEIKLAAADSQPEAFVFVSRTGAVLWQRNVTRALRDAQTRAVDEHGRPTFPDLHRRNEHGRLLKPERGTVPSLHSFRHTLATLLANAGESSDELAFLLGHANGNVTRAVYVHELADARRRSMRRDKIAAVYGNAVETNAVVRDRQTPTHDGGNVRQLRRTS